MGTKVFKKKKRVLSEKYFKKNLNEKRCVLSVKKTVKKEVRSASSIALLVCTDDH